MNIITFGKYKGMPVTRVLRIDPSYFRWCKNNVRWFKFSKRDYEIYLEWNGSQYRNCIIHDPDCPCYLDTLGIYVVDNNDTTYIIKNHKRRD